MGIKSVRVGTGAILALGLCFCSSDPARSPLEVADSEVVLGDVLVSGSIVTHESHANVSLRFENRSSRPVSLGIHGGCPVTVMLIYENSGRSAPVFDNQACPDVRHYIAMEPNGVEVYETQLRRQVNNLDGSAGTWVGILHLSAFPNVPVKLRPQQ